MRGVAGKVCSGKAPQFIQLCGTLRIAPLIAIRNNIIAVTKTYNWSNTPLVTLTWTIFNALRLSWFQLFMVLSAIYFCMHWSSACLPKMITLYGSSWENCKPRFVYSTTFHFTRGPNHILSEHQQSPSIDSWEQLFYTWQFCIQKSLSANVKWQRVLS